MNGQCTVESVSVKKGQSNQSINQSMNKSVSDRLGEGREAHSERERERHTIQ